METRYAVKKNACPHGVPRCLDFGAAGITGEAVGWLDVAMR